MMQQTYIHEQIQMNRAVVDNFEKKFLINYIAKFSAEIYQALKNGKKILLFGNGGSAAEADHIAAEFVGRCLVETKAYPAISLTESRSTVTAISNDYGFDQVFARQVDALATAGDICIGLSASGKSKNVVNGLEAAGKKKCSLHLWTGESSNEYRIDDLNIIKMASTITSRIQEGHLFLGHLLAEVVEQKQREDFVD
jgi:D-sedoheptulose 7-phosphate isomerase